MATDSPQSATLAQPVTDEDHIRGAAQAPVTLVEYADFECPHCGRAHPILKTLVSVLGNDLRFVYRHFPLSKGHPHAQQAAEAAEAAGAQGRFWEMHDLLFKNQRALKTGHLEHYARELALDVERFIDELQRDVHAGRVRDDFNSGVRSGVNGTPSFFINGKRYDGAYDYDSLLEAIQSAATEATGS
ncbi:MAG: DsbA family protein [Chloroflexota bacterium]